MTFFAALFPAVAITVFVLGNVLLLQAIFMGPQHEDSELKVGTPADQTSNATTGVLAA